MGIDLGTIHNTVIYNGYSMLDCPGIFSCQRYLGMSKTWLYSQNCNSTRLLGQIMINRGTQDAICSDKPTWDSNLAIPYVPWC